MIFARFAVGKMTLFKTTALIVLAAPTTCHSMKPALPSRMAEK